jgi:dsRNA-specific ribonuclease
MQHVYPSPATTFSPPLKRNRSGEFPHPPAEIPHLPELDRDLILEALTHESIRPPNAAKGEGPMDNTRLAVLGDRVLNSAVTLILFKKKPFLSVDEITVRRFR